MDEEKQKRLLHLAYQLAMVHIEDGDVLGRMAKELLELVNQSDSSISDMPYDEDCPPVNV